MGAAQEAVAANKDGLGFGAPENFSDAPLFDGGLHEVAPCGGDSVYGASARSCVALEDPLIRPQRLPPGAATRRCLLVEGWAASAARASSARARATSSLSTASLPTTKPMTRCRNATWAPALNPYSPSLAPAITKSRVEAVHEDAAHAGGDGRHVVVGVLRKRGARHKHDAPSRK